MKGGDVFRNHKNNMYTQYEMGGHKHKEANLKSQRMNREKVTLSKHKPRTTP